MPKYLIAWQSEEGERGSLGTGTGDCQELELEEFPNHRAAANRIKKDYDVNGTKLFSLNEINLEKSGYGEFENRLRAFLEGEGYKISPRWTQAIFGVIETAAAGEHLELKLLEKAMSKDR